MRFEMNITYEETTYIEHNCTDLDNTIYVINLS
jgi:hypothetical protein